MSNAGAAMATELREAPDAVRRQETSRAALQQLIARCRARPPQLVVTCARGSSGHAAAFGKHLIERHLGIPVAAGRTASAAAKMAHRQVRYDKPSGIGERNQKAETRNGGGS
jgi:glucosamine--fructose-6-phosphate aminotransferase (isomerizing)